jgi:hypothetical protein
MSMGQSGKSRGGEMSDFGYILKAELTRSVDGLSARLGENIVKADSIVYNNRSVK